MKISPTVAELFHADGQTERRADMMKLIFAFRNIANALKKKGKGLVAFCRSLRNI
jgi:hypothetical protein